MKSLVEDFLARGINVVGLAIMNLVRRHEADTCVMMILIVPIEKMSAKCYSVPDAAKPLRKLGLIF